MRVPARLIASERMISRLRDDPSLTQLANVAHIPGIVGHALAMPDIHPGYGMPIGGVAAVDPANNGIIAPGMVGYDANCGMRLLSSSLDHAEATEALEPILAGLFSAIPSGVGAGGGCAVNARELAGALAGGAQWAIAQGMGAQEDLEALESSGRWEAADPDALSPRARERGKSQLGSLGAGNHFIEIQRVDEVFDTALAGAFGLRQGSLAVMIHTGSRGLGHQMCVDQLAAVARAAGRYDIRVPDPQLLGVPCDSSEGRHYIAALKSAANFAWANRQIITHRVREVFSRVLRAGPAELGMRVVSDTGHNLAREEEHLINGTPRQLVVVRKGAALALPPGHAQNPEIFRATGMPVLVPGTMGTASYVLVGTEGAAKETYCSICHGAGRAMSRSQAMRTVRGHDLAAQLAQQGIIVQTHSLRGLAEEAPAAYKDITEVVDTCCSAGIARKVARLKPLAVIK